MLERKTFWLDTRVYKRLVALAKRDGLKTADLVRRAVVEFLRRNEND